MGQNGVDNRSLRLPKSFRFTSSFGLNITEIAETQTLRSGFWPSARLSFDVHKITDSFFQLYSSVEDFMSY